MVIAAFRDAGLNLYNDVVLVRSMGTAPLFARRTYASGAKLQPARLDATPLLRGHVAHAPAQQLHERLLVFRKPAPGIPARGAVKRLGLSPKMRPVPRAARPATT